MTNPFSNCSVPTMNELGTYLRETQEVEDRSPFDRDRDRILFSKAFRRLAGKTQIFHSSSNDHLRSRLTYVLEVEQIATSLTKKFGLETDLSRAIALGHDLGHTPFGHVGERTLDFIMNGCYEFDNIALEKEDKGFCHNLQGVRTICDLSELYPDFTGLNLTKYTLWGIANHYDLLFDADGDLNKKPCKYCYEEKCSLKPISKPCINNYHTYMNYYDRYVRRYFTSDSKEFWSFEGILVKYADRIAQRHHDIEDGIFADILSKDEVIDVIQKYFYNRFTEQQRKYFDNAKGQKEVGYFLSYLSKLLISIYEGMLFENSTTKLTEFKINKREDFLSAWNKQITKENAQNILCYDDGYREQDEKLHEFLKTRILNSYLVKRMDGYGSYIIRKLYKAYLTNPQQLSDRTIRLIAVAYDKNNKNRPIGDLRELFDNGNMNIDLQKVTKRRICDHIACMTDDYAISEYQKLYGILPSW